MNRYSAQKQYWKAKQTKQDKEKIADVVLLQKLQVFGCTVGPLLVGATGGLVRVMGVWRTLLSELGQTGREVAIQEPDVCTGPSCQ